MATINLVVPPVDEKVFSGGFLCLFEYAKGLRARGHDLRVVPLLPSPEPKWFSGDFGWLSSDLLEWKSPIGAGSRELAGLPLEVQYGLYQMYACEMLRNRLPPADITIATACTTALSVHLYGTGRKFYFAQHFEPYFSCDIPNSIWFEFEARRTYSLPLRIIANSTWLRGRLCDEVGVNATVCPNAIDHAIYFGQPRARTLGREVKIISYGGRLAQLKGFRDMAEGMRLARERLPDRVLRWRVFGSSLLGPNNPIAEYESLGFLEPRDLAEAYRGADILLSASWYESFPLFPLEAMACGLPVITTQPGTEEFAIPHVTAEIVSPKDPESIAGGLIRLITQDSYRSSIAEKGCDICRRFDWQSATSRMESILLETGGTGTVTRGESVPPICPAPR